MTADDERANRAVRTMDIEMSVEGRTQERIAIIDRGTKRSSSSRFIEEYYLEFTRCDGAFERTERGG
jgi:hypothetical protein